jgi:hypothetical protein
LASAGLSGLHPDQIDELIRAVEAIMNYAYAIPRAINV